MTNLKLKHELDCLPQNAKILDAGGWFKTFPSATHVVDFMPWETREAKLQLEALPTEKFTKETWYQIDFLNPNLKLPFENKYFDFSICSHTLEDLKEPLYLLRELRRVSKAGYVEVPSRLHEQTLGVKDRKSDSVGHPHHHWIIDREENKLVFYKKHDSIVNAASACAIPLNLYEKSTINNPDLAITSIFWVEHFEFNFESGLLALNKAREFKQSLPINWKNILHDKVLRSGRRAKDFFLKKNTKSSEKWWEQMVELSQPYSLIKLS